MLGQKVSTRMLLSQTAFLACFQGPIYDFQCPQVILIIFKDIPGIEFIYLCITLLKYMDQCNVKGRKFYLYKIIVPVLKIEEKPIFVLNIWV